MEGVIELNFLINAIETMAFGIGIDAEVLSEDLQSNDTDDNNEMNPFVIDKSN